MIQRNKTRQVKCGNAFIGGINPISVQSMTNTDTRDVEATVNQIKELEAVGCEIVRVAVPDMEAALAIGQIKNNISIPLVADIHFDYRLAIEAMKQGVDKLRINPGNIGDEERVKEVVEMAKIKRIPIRIGVNGGSLDKEILQKYDGVTAEGLVESAMKHVHILEKYEFEDIVISIKASDVQLTYEAYEMLASQVDYPLHIGVTEAGTPWKGTIKSAMGIGAMLLTGIGDTLRVSLTGNPVEEVRVGREILNGLGIRRFGIEIISCPTCGRCNVELEKVVLKLEKALENVESNLKVAVMGCAVNGPGEAKGADLGVACGKGEALLFRKGEIVKKIKEEEIVETLLQEIKEMDKN